MRKTSLRWFCQVQMKPIYATVRKLDCLEFTLTSKESRQSKKTWIEIIRNDRKAPNLTNKLL